MARTPPTHRLAQALASCTDEPEGCATLLVVCTGIARRHVATLQSEALVECASAAGGGPHIAPQLASCMGPICQALAALAGGLQLHRSGLLPRLAEAWALLRRPKWLDDEGQLQEWGLQLMQALYHGVGRVMTEQGPPLAWLQLMRERSLQVGLGLAGGGAAGKASALPASAAGWGCLHHHRARRVAQPPLCPPLLAQLMVEEVVVRAAEALDPSYTSLDLPAAQRLQREQLLARASSLCEPWAQGRAARQEQEQPRSKRTYVVVEQCLSMTYILTGAGCTTSFRQSSQGQLRTLAA